MIQRALRESSLDMQQETIDKPRGQDHCRQTKDTEAHDKGLGRKSRENYLRIRQPHTQIQGAQKMPPQIQG